MSDVAHEAAAGLIEDIFEAVEAEDIPSGQSEPAAEQVLHDADPLNPDIPEDVREMLDEPDFDGEAELEVQEVEDYVPSEFDDPQLVEERKKRIAAEKKASWFEKQRLVSERGKWRAEIEKYAPLADADQILQSATSRRAALRAARAQHDRLYARVKPHLSKQQDIVDEAISGAMVAARTEVADAWGKPLVGAANSAPPAAAVKADQQKRVEGARTLQERIRARISMNTDGLTERVWKD